MKLHKPKMHLVLLLANHLPQIQHCFSSTSSKLSASSYLQVHVQNISNKVSGTSAEASFLLTSRFTRGLGHTSIMSLYMSKYEVYS